MQKFGNILLIVILSSISLKGQELSAKLEGRVLSTSNDVTAVHVSNTIKNRGTITDANGYFEISVNLGDTLVFSAVQFKRKEIVVTQAILGMPLFFVPMEDALTQLNEVVVSPYYLSGELKRDMGNLKIGPIITASTEGLLNAFVKPPTQSQRKLYTARTWDFKVVSIKLDPLINFFSGRTKMLKQRVALETNSALMERVRKFYQDSLYIKELKIPQEDIGDFIYFCELDTSFNSLVKINDKLKLWEFLKKKSAVYLKNPKP